MAKEAMHWWYGNKEKRLEALQNLYPVKNADSDEIKNILDKMQEWNRVANISYTPTIYVNGYRLPEMYGIKDLKNIFRLTQTTKEEEEININ